jgi:hypothetical protein
VKFKKLVGRLIISVAFISSIVLALPLSGFAQAPEFELVRSHPTPFVDAIISDIDHDGYSDVLYRTYIQWDLMIMYGQSDGSLSAPTALGVSSSAMAVGFINNDTLIDIVSSGVYYLIVLLNNGDRTFTIDSMYQGYMNWVGVTLGYFNDDNYLDIVASYSNLYLGDGQGDFNQVIGLPFSGQTVQTSDFNNDGIDDILALDQHGNGGIYLNDGDGGFTLKDSFSLGDATMGSTIDDAIVDFDRDGDADFAFITPINFGTYSYIAIGYTNNDGSIREMDTLLCSGTAYSMAVSDINNDNYLDIIAADVTNHILVIYLGLSEGGFADSVQIPNEVEVYPWALSCGDIDRDGNTDLISGDLYTDSVNIFMNLAEDKSILPQRMSTTGHSNVSVNIINPENLGISKNIRTVAGSDYWRLDVDDDQTVDEKAIDYNAQYGEYTLVIKPKPGTVPGSLFSSEIELGNNKAILFKNYETPEYSYSRDGKFISDSIVFYYTVEPQSSVFPENGGTASAMPTFNWSNLVEPSGIVVYQFQLDRYYDFRSPIFDIDDLTSPQFTPTTALGEDSVFYWRYRAYDGISWSEFSHPFAVYITDYICGDVTGDAIVNIFDITYIIAYLYLSGPSPENISAADVNNDGMVNIFDITALIEFLYLDGPVIDCP